MGSGLAIKHRHLLLLSHSPFVSQPGLQSNNELRNTLQFPAWYNCPLNNTFLQLIMALAYPIELLFSECVLKANVSFGCNVLSPAKYHLFL